MIPIDEGVRGSLANERTHLAWQRTAMSWAGAGAVVTRYFAEDGVVRPRTATGALMMVIGALIWLDGARRYRRAAEAIHGGQAPVVPTAAIRVVWVATVAVIAATIVVEVLA